MISPFFVYSLHLDALQRFVSLVGAAVEAEWSSIESRCVEGQFSREDLEFEESVCLESLDIAARAVVQELANLIERAIQDAARAAFEQSKYKKGPRSISTWEDLTKQYEVDRCAFDTLLSLINGHHRISIEGFEKWQDVERIRSTANDLKHRFGKLPKSDWSPNRGIPQYRDLTIHQAREDIQSISVFLHQLVTATNTAEAPQAHVERPGSDTRPSS